MLGHRSNRILIALLRVRSSAYFSLILTKQLPNCLFCVEFTTSFPSLMALLYTILFCFFSILSFSPSQSLCAFLSQRFHRSFISISLVLPIPFSNTSFHLLTLLTYFLRFLFGNYWPLSSDFHFSRAAF